MLYSDADPTAWSLKHGVEIINDNCRGCGRLVEVNIPIISADFVGFESKIHECGAQYRISVLKPRKPLEEYDG